jgi:hypothetical protein
MGAGPGNGGGVAVYTNTAFLKSDGDDGTAELNNDDLPYETMEAAWDDLEAEHSGEAVTVRVMDNVPAATDALKSHLTNPATTLTLRGHGGVRTLTGTLTASGDPGSGAAGESGRSVKLYDIVLAAYDGSGGAGDTDFSGGDGGDVWLMTKDSGFSDWANFVSDGGAGNGAGSNGRRGYLLNHEGHVILTDEGNEPLTDEDGEFLTTGAGP